MKAIRYFLIDAKTTHKEKDGSIIMLRRFENQDKALQYHKIVAVPKKYQDKIDVGDTLVCHFNIVVFQRKDGVETKSNYCVQGDLFRVPIDMCHFVIKKDGSYVFFNDDCLIAPEGNSTETIRKSGIIMPDLRTETAKKDTMLKGRVYAKSEEMTDVDVGELVGMSKYSDYAIELPDGEIKWFVNYSSVLFSYDN
jgi:co-chaperonin GroES (HSP10)